MTGMSCRIPPTRGTMVRRFFGLCALVLLLVALAGCQTTNKVDDTWQPVRSQPQPQYHTVNWPNENIQAIAKWYTGSEENWKAIANANPNIIPNKLNPGERIFIPATLLKTRAAMRKGFLEEWLRRTHNRSATRSATPQGEITPLLVPKLHKFNQEDQGGEDQPAPPDMTEPDDGDDLELFGPK